MSNSVLIIGAGCFGVTAAKELRGRGYKVCNAQHYLRYGIIELDVACCR
jgi:hypothetical protein